MVDACYRMHNQSLQDLWTISYVVYRIPKCLDVVPWRLRNTFALLNPSRLPSTWVHLLSLAATKPHSDSSPLYISSCNLVINFTLQPSICTYDRFLHKLIESKHLGLSRNPLIVWDITASLSVSRLWTSLPHFQSPVSHSDFFLAPVSFSRTPRCVACGGVTNVRVTVYKRHWECPFGPSHVYIREHSPFMIHLLH